MRGPVAGESPVRPFERPSGNGRWVETFRVLLALASIATIGVALWLFSVIAAILPSRDPGHISLWRSAAIGCFAYSVLSWGYLIRAPRSPFPRWALAVASSAAIAIGLFCVISMATLADRGERFEGYLLLMGVLLALHGLVAIACAVVTPRGGTTVRPRSPRRSGGSWPSLPYRRSGPSPP